MSYADTLNSEQKRNIQTLVERMNANGITNPISQAGLLAVVSKESSFVPKNEISYRNTSPERIRQIFGNRVSSLTDAQISSLSQNDNAFFDQVYGPNSGIGLGNTNEGDGYKYRGRGFNQITGKSAYKRYGEMIGKDLVSNPDLLNKVDVAADATIAFFKQRFKEPSNQLSAYNSSNINDFKNVSDSTGAFYHANAGWGKSLERISADPTGGKAKADSRAPSLYDYVKNAIGVVKKNLIPTAIITTLLIISVYVLYKQINKS